MLTDTVLQWPGFFPPPSLPFSLLYLLGSMENKNTRLSTARTLSRWERELQCVTISAPKPAPLQYLPYMETFPPVPYRSPLYSLEILPKTSSGLGNHRQYGTLDILVFFCPYHLLSGQDSLKLPLHMGVVFSQVPFTNTNKHGPSDT